MANGLRRARVISVLIMFLSVNWNRKKSGEREKLPCLQRSRLHCSPLVRQLKEFLKQGKRSTPCKRDNKAPNLVA